MKEKIVARYKAKFPDVTLSNSRLDAIADRLSKKITDENEIDAKLDELNELSPFAEIQKSDDAIRDLKGRLKNSTPKEERTDPPKETTPASTTTTDEVPAWAKAIVDSNKALQEKLENIEKEKAQTRRRESLATSEKLKGIPPAFYKRIPIPETDDEFETFVDSIKTDYEAFKQEANDETLSGEHKPGGGNGAPDNGKVSAMFSEVMAARKAAKEAAQKQS